MNRTEVCFAGKLGCGCYVAAAIVDMSNPERIRGWAKTSAEWNRRGIAVEISTVEFVRANLRPCSHKAVKTNNQLAMPTLHDAPHTS